MQQVALSQLPIILLPGLNGDPRVFAAQIAAFPAAKVLRWIPPVGSEGLAEYARRLAWGLDPDQECLVGGVSFGGIVAMELARHLRAKACLVIGSARDVEGLPTPIRMLRPFAAVANSAALSWAVRGGWCSAAASPRVGRRIRRLAPRDKAFQRWAIQALLTWKARELPPCPLLQIHGACDTRFPAGKWVADQVVSHAGHLLTLTHGDEVNAFIAAAVRRYAA